ncbi:MAG: hypothetical protein JNJ57_15175 [Saprospiraceae bacterium]|nr:hypothetical protein [Saprospiraceae bacterium]
MSICRTATLLLLFVFLGNSGFAQRYLTEKRPDLVLTKITAKRDNSNQLFVIWSIQNAGNATAKLVGLNRESLITLAVDASDKKDDPNVQHNWSAIAESVNITPVKDELLPGETITGNCKVDVPSGAWDKLVCIRTTIEAKDDLSELIRENNIKIAGVAK